MRETMPPQMLRRQQREILYNEPQHAMMVRLILQFVDMDSSCHPSWVGAPNIRLRGYFQQIRATGAPFSTHGIEHAHTAEVLNFPISALSYHPSPRSISTVHYGADP